jgi:hypothetical protein
MKPYLLILSLILTGACQSGPQSRTSATPGQGAVAIQVVPNPIVAQRVSGETFDFPFEVILRESGGRPITVNRVTATVHGPGGLQLSRESWDADKIRSMGYSVDVGAGGEVRYRFAPRQKVPDDRLFGSVSAELRVDATDDSGAPTNARTVVTVVRG